MSAASIESISEFLLHAGTNFRVLDIGRGLDELDKQTFLEIEGAQIPAPKPRQQHAWFAVVFWNTQAATQHYIWFLKLPLDERGLVVTASRNHFLEIIIDALGTSLADDTEKAQTLPDNPYSFVPPQSLMAQTNARIKQMLSLPPSSGYLLAKNYVQAPGVQDWQQIPVQGIADLAYELGGPLGDTVAAGFSSLAPAFRDTLMQSCEVVPVSDSLFNKFKYALTTSEDLNLSALRGLASPVTDARLAPVIEEVLQRDSLDMDALSVLAARHFTQFDAQRIKLFFEQAARVDEATAMQGALFHGLFADLVQVPALRPQVLAVLRDDARSPRLSNAIGALFSQTQQAKS
ncbi:DUF3549 family protein [Alteromonas antoniana]|uniref:DUF3549 family protein n=1 Tax=Alteromonas antoniana TaxID=2803813 RepID=UPI001C446C10|nr:DUF3549 family protein [Alteromonas antoniana]